MKICWLPAALLAVACDDDPNKDTAPKGDTDTDTEIHSGTPSDTEDTSPVDTELSFTFAIDGDWKGTALSLAPLYFEEQIRFGDPVSSTVVEADQVSMDAPILGKGDLAGLPFDTDGAIFMPILHEDSNGDLVLDEDELVVGIGPAWVVYLDYVPPELEKLAEQGWNALQVTLSMEGAAITDSYPLDAIPLSTAFRPDEDLTVGGTYQGKHDLADLGLVVVPPMVWEGTKVAPLQQAALEDPWTVALSGAPPDDHFPDPKSPEPAAEMIAAFDDSDGTGFSATDAPAYPACHEDMPVMAVYLRASNNVEGLFNASVAGIMPGWNALVETKEGPIKLDDKQAAALVLADCGGDPPKR